MIGKDYRRMFISGISIMIAGLILLVYCITSYSEIKHVTDKIDFDELDNNIHMSTSDKYYKHISIYDAINQKLEKNKNLPIKNMSCAYLDYSQHNIKSLYKLIFKSANEDTSRREVVENNIKSLISIYDSYKSCRKTSEYQEELRDMLEDIENYDDIYSQGRMETFVNGNKDIERANQNPMQDDVFPQYSEGGIQSAAEQQNEKVLQDTYPQNTPQTGTPRE